MWGRLVPHPHVADKNWEGYLGYGDPPLRSKGSQPHTRTPSPGFQCQKEMSPTPGCKNQRGLWLSETQAVPLKGPMNRLTQTLSSSAGAAAQTAPGIYRGELNCLTSAGRFLPDRSAGRGYCSSSQPSPTKPAGRCHM